MDDKTLRKILKEELKGFATKEDLKGTEQRLTKVIEREAEDLAGLVAVGFEKFDEKLDKTDILSLNVRVTKLEEKVLPN